jgi:hypothetical protein
VEGTGIEVWIGPLALPGTYKARLIVNGRSLVQSFEVRMDPRCSASPAELQIQFQWAQRAFDDLIATRVAARQATAAHHDILAHELGSLASLFTAVLNVMESADRAPTAQSIQLYLHSDKLLRRRLLIPRQ